MPQERQKAKAFTYVVASDSGFAPNPWHGFCTLACCKPKIRKSAQPGDLVIGLSPRSERVIYMMRVQEKLDFASYWEDSRFFAKRPDVSSNCYEVRRGDCIYEPLPDGGFRQLPSNHWDSENAREHEGNKERDLSTDAVLISEDFAYFGGSGPELPPHLSFAKAARGHRCNFGADEVEQLEQFFFAASRGVLGTPKLMPPPSTQEHRSPRCD